MNTIRCLSFNLGALWLGDPEKPYLKTIDFLGETLALIRSTNPDIIFLQESQALYDKLMAELTDYKGPPKETIARVVSFILVRKHFEGVFDWIPFPEANRNMAVFHNTSQNLLIISVHLTPGRSNDQANLRGRQYLTMMGLQKDYNQVIIGGDFNCIEPFRDLFGFTDVWLAEPVPTWHNNRRPNDRYHGPVCHYRFDRFLTKGYRISNKFINEVNRISDHDALIIDVSPI